MCLKLSMVLEIVDVEEGQCETLVGHGEQALHVLLEQGAVRQLRELVKIRPPHEPFLGALSLGDIERCRQQQALVMDGDGSVCGQEGASVDLALFGRRY
jgi:hypothetical protein